jgi:hypothetical protein
MICNWRGFVQNNWSEQYARVVIRYLDTPLSSFQADALQSFVKSVVSGSSKRNSVTPALAAMAAASAASGAGGGRNSVQRASVNGKRVSIKRASLMGAAAGKMYFSSQLVAAAYRHIGLLRPNAAPTTYLPGSFAAKTQLHLLHGARLSPEFAVTFEPSKATAGKP